MCTRNSNTHLRSMILQTFTRAFQRWEVEGNKDKNVGATNDGRFYNYKNKLCGGRGIL